MSTSFKDTEGRDWHLSVTTWHLKAVRDRTGVHLGKLLDDGLRPFRELVGDPIAFVDVLYVLCQEQADKRGVTDQEFGRALGGDVLEAAGLAFEEAYLLFCPSRTRQILTPLLTKARAAVETRHLEMVKKIAEIDLDSITTPSALSVPASAELTPPG